MADGSRMVRMDEPISMKSGIALDAAGVIFTGSTDDRVAQAVIAEDCTNFALYNLNLTAGCYEYGIYIIRSNTFTIENCTISNALYKGLVMMGENKNFTIRNNTVSYNGNGAVFLNGNISNGIITGNDVVDNYGTRNLTAGIVMTSMEIDDYYTAYNEFKDEHLYNLLDTPHDIVLYQNNVKHNNSSGIYSDGAYQVYIVENIIYQNDTSIVRAWHAHQYEKKWFYAVKGSFTTAFVKIDNWESPSINLAAGVFHFGQIRIPELKCFLKEKGIVVR